MRSGELAAAAGVNVQTLRYYERRGLLPEPDRSLGGHREYTDDAVALLRVVKATQRLGFTLDEIAELLDVGRRPHPPPDLRARARAKLAEIDRRMSDLARMRAELTRLIDARCANLQGCSCAECPVPFTDQQGPTPDSPALDSDTVSGGTTEES